MKTLNEKLAMLAEWMGMKRFVNPFRDIDESSGLWIVTNPDETETIMADLNYHTSFDALWPVWVRFRDWPYFFSMDHGDKHGDWTTRIKDALLSSYTPAPAFDLLVEGVEWLQSIQ